MSKKEKIQLPSIKDQIKKISAAENLDDLTAAIKVKSGYIDARIPVRNAMRKKRTELTPPEGTTDAGTTDVIAKAIELNLVEEAGNFVVFKEKRFGKKAILKNKEVMEELTTLIDKNTDDGK